MAERFTVQRAFSTQQWSMVRLLKERLFREAYEVIARTSCDGRLLRYGLWNLGPNIWALRLDGEVLN